ncbi:hypothetical protein M0R01_04450 [bacterium]|jgi:hypothetical protein|nr:hypothetical protein [bacterium]
MSTQIDWAKLTNENRVKAPGIPWTQAEMDAIHSKGMNPDDVRAGFLDPLEIESDKPRKLSQLRKPELVIKAKELGIDFDEKVATRGDLILEIKKAEKKSDEKNV